ncbi:hypothetical protein CEXT_99481 [Caerostris extrusa]|uniref:Uncharacterized protein n=1 Tax=Caerostris extrusa TaxID=172846 RepID=A0AAV4XKE0_CAEEX|nr:hypothetical protein CEXT_99481 [Caerostris extrusa]
MPPPNKPRCPLSTNRTGSTVVRKHARWMRFPVASLITVMACVPIQDICSLPCRSMRVNKGDVKMSSKCRTHFLQLTCESQKKETSRDLLLETQGEGVKPLLKITSPQNLIQVLLWKISEPESFENPNHPKF